MKILKIKNNDNKMFNFRIARSIKKKLLITKEDFQHGNSKNFESSDI